MAAAGPGEPEGRSRPDDAAAASPDAAPAPALSRAVLVLGLVSLLTDAASDMVWPLLPVFLLEHLHRSVAFVGLIEGVADATAAVGKYLVGRYSDRIARRKPMVLLGYGLSAAMRPLLALASSPWHALFIRVLDRAGKGTRSAPRDALLAAATSPARRALAFGFHRAMDNLGAVIGPLLAALVLWWRPGALRLLFALAAIPGALAVVAVAVLVREAPAPRPAQTSGAALLAPGDDPGGGFRRYLAVVGLFALANASDFFLLARARQVGVAVHALPLVWAGLSMLRAVAATPGGLLADRFGRGRALALGWGIYAAVYAALAFTRSPLGLLACLLAYGAYYGLTEGAERALVASFAPPSSLGRAYGLFAMVTGLAAIPASALFGLLYPVGDGRAAFLVAAALAALAAALMAREARRAAPAARPER